MCKSYNIYVGGEYMRLSKTEQEIMEFFWERQENQTFAGMLAYWNQERKKNW